AYLAPAAVRALWRTIAEVLSTYPHGLYLSNLQLGAATASIPGVAAFRALLTRFTGGSVHIHFDRAGDAEATLCAAGFARATAYPTDHFAAALDLPGARASAYVHVCAAHAGSDDPR
ncbi:MAG: hypothetical protein AAGC55_14450, partial [Myxococcota bacterium]